MEAHTQGMATQADVRRIALSLPETEEEKGRFAFGLRIKEKLKGYAWVWMERIDPKKPRIPNPGVLAVRVPNVGHKEALIAAQPDKFFTEPHYNGFPAVLVRLAEMRVPELRVLLEEAWRCMQPAKSAKQRRPASKRPSRRRPPNA